jgi:hypothetical protein
MPAAAVVGSMRPRQAVATQQPCAPAHRALRRRAMAQPMPEAGIPAQPHRMRQLVTPRLRTVVAAVEHLTAAVAVVDMPAAESANL